jgi:class I fructose-bisphosphate aldolase
VVLEEESMSQYYAPPQLAQLDLSTGKRARLWRLLYGQGPGSGRLLVLPIDQGIEHGPMDFFANPDCKFPRYQFELARQGGYSAIALHYGLAAKYYRDFAGELPLILKLNGKTCVPPDNDPLSTLVSNVEDAVRLGADAVGYTVYVGSPRQGEDISQFMQVRRECDRYGMPLIMWAYPRGSAIEAKGGRDSFYAIDYAARLADELGADVVKVNYPRFSDKDSDSPAPYNTLKLSEADALRQVILSAGRCFVLMSGGSKIGDEEMLAKVQLAMEAGATGLIFGRNMWQRPLEEALAVTSRVKQLMRS